MLRSFYLLILLAILAIVPAERVSASHGMAFDISYECLGGGEYVFTARLYRDCDGIAAPTNVTLDFNSTSCGLTQSFTLPRVGPGGTEVSPLCPAELPNSTCSGGTLPGVEEHVYRDTITMPAQCSDWVISYELGNRNAAITNISTPGSEFLYAEVELDNSGGLCNSSPEFTSLPTPYICLGQQFCYNHGTFDSDGDSLVYSLIPARTNGGVNVTYVAPFSGTYPLSTTSGTFTIDPETGNMCFTPNQVAFAVVTVLVEEYRNGVRIGSTMRELQIVVQNCTNQQPQLVSPGIVNSGGGTVLDSVTMEVCPGELIDFEVDFSDANLGDNITLNSNIGSSIPGATFTQTGTNPATAAITWAPTPLDTGVNAFTIAVEDDGCPILGTQFIAFQIFVRDGTFAGDDTVFCDAGDPVQLQALGGTAFNWNVLSGDPGSLSCFNCQSPVATPSVTTTYEVVSNLSATCNNRDTVVVENVPDIDAGIVTNPVEYCTGGSASLNINPSPGGQGPFAVTWSPAQGLNNPNLEDPITNTLDSTRYFVEVVSAAGCRIRDSVDVNVLPAPSPTITATADPSTICTGETAQLTVNAATSLNDDFDGGIDGSQWSSVTGAASSTDCGAQSGDALYFSGATREATTIDFNTSSCSNLDFCFRLGDGTSPCENLDAGDDVLVEYSNDGGTTWFNLATLDDATYGTAGWTCLSLPLPPGALGANVRFRWQQPTFAGGIDHWAIDDVSLTCSGGTGLSYTWTPAASLNDPNIENPVASPTATTTYNVVVASIANPVCQTTTNVDVTVNPLQFNVLADQTTVCMGETVQLNVTGIGTGGANSDDFDSGINPGLWTSVTGGSATADCGTPSGTGNALYFDGTTREAETIDFNFNSCTSIDFCFHFGDGSSPCETVDPGEDILLEYSTDGGATWNTLNTYLETTFGGTGWNCVSEAIPPGAVGPSTRLRWSQTGNSGTCCDHIAIDNVQIVCASSFDINWSPVASVSDPNIINPTAQVFGNTTFQVYVEDQTNPLCNNTEPITITVDSTLFVDAGPGGTHCEGDLVNLGATVNLPPGPGISFEDDFNGGFNPSNWGSVTGASATTDCGSITGDALYFSGATREAVTVPLDLSSCSDIDFCFRLADGTSPCENLDAGDDVVFSYSIDGGASWNNLLTMDDATYGGSGWTCENVAFPPAAQTTSTLLRWAQPTFSGSGFDHWALDDIIIACGAGSYNYNWQPSGNVSNPNIANPTTTKSSNDFDTLTVTVTGGVCPVSDTTILAECTILPVEWLSFTGKRVGQESLLEWLTAAEVNAEYFAVERAAGNAPGNFRQIGTVLARGDINRGGKYEFWDRAPLQGVNYYRIQQVDFDGNAHLSNTIAVRFGEDGELQQRLELFPNPASNILNTRFFGAPASGGAFVLYSAEGKELYRKAVAGGEVWEARIAVSDLPGGVYLLSAEDGAGNQLLTNRFIVR